MGWEDPIGKRIKVSDEDEEDEYLTVIGVVQDFHQLSLYQELEPMAFFYGRNRPYIHVKFNPEQLESFQNHLEKTWAEVYPNAPFNTYFLDQHFFESYEADQKRSEIFMLFSGITIFIACLGLLGLASFSSEQRTKEIGIRKVVGANEWSIILLLTREFFTLIFISMFFAFLGSFYLMQNWLSKSFVYHTEIQFVSFVYAGLISLFFVMLTVSFHAYRAANSNPIDALRTE